MLACACLREAVTNVIRHSRARHCRIRLSERMGEVSLEVTDDGRGFPGQNPEDPQNPATPDGAHGSGLRGMSERLSAIGGSSVGRSARDITAAASVITTAHRAVARSRDGRRSYLLSPL